MSLSCCCGEHYPQAREAEAVLSADNFAQDVLACVSSLRQCTADLALIALIYQEKILFDVTEPEILPLLTSLPCLTCQKHYQQCNRTADSPAEEGLF